MTNEEQKLREFAEHWMPMVRYKDKERFIECLTALISENYTANEDVEKMVEEKMPSNKKIHEAALAWAKEHSEAPDKDYPDWLIRDYEAGAYFVRQCMGCWNKEEGKMVEERLREELIKYMTWYNGHETGADEEFIDEYLSENDSEDEGTCSL